MRVEFKTDTRNERSRSALAAIGAKPEGIFRKHMYVPGAGRRDSAYFSITDDDWPQVREHLAAGLAVQGGERLMPRRDDIRKILLIGSGPIVIGQAAEFDYSGTQACKVLREEGYEVVLVNSNPATIMTDPEFADATYIEPLRARGRRPDHREGAARRAAADAGRPDRAQPRQGAARRRHARASTGSS